MKHLVMIAVVAGFALTACNNSTSTSETVPSRSSIEFKASDTSVVTGDNSLNALDWPGTYAGIVPCGDCEGIEITLMLNNDMTYNFTSKYLGKKEASVEEKKGTLRWSMEGNTITLNGVENAPSKYLVGENRLFQLDRSGNRITGDLADKYILTKQ